MRDLAQTNLFGSLRELLHSANNHAIDPHVLSLLHHTWCFRPQLAERDWLPYTRELMAIRQLRGAKLWPAHAVFGRMLDTPASPAWELVTTLSLHRARPDWRVKLWNVWRCGRCMALDRLELGNLGLGVRLEQCLPGAQRAPWRLRELALDVGCVDEAGLHWLARNSYLDHAEHLELEGVPARPYHFFELVRELAPKLESVALRSLPQKAQTLHTILAAELTLLRGDQIELEAPSSRSFVHAYDTEQIEAVARKASLFPNALINNAFSDLLADMARPGTALRPRC